MNQGLNELIIEDFEFGNLPGKRIPIKRESYGQYSLVNLLKRFEGIFEKENSTIDNGGDHGLVFKAYYGGTIYIGRIYCAIGEPFEGFLVEISSNYKIPDELVNKIASIGER